MGKRINGMKTRGVMIAVIIIGCALIGSKIASTAYLPWPTIMQNNQRTSVYPGFGEIGNMHTAYIKWTRGISSFSNLAALADFDGDNIAEVVVVDINSVVYLLDGTDGSTKWSKSLGGGTVWSSSPSVADIDDDSILEIVIGIDNGVVYAVDGTNGNIEWSKNVTSTEIRSSPAIGDIDGNGTVEVVMVLKDKTVALNGVDGSIKWIMPMGSAGGDDSYGIPALGDVDGDGAIEVIAGSNDGSLYALNSSDGSEKWRVPIQVANFVDCLFIPAIADIDNDGVVEVVVHPSQDVYAIDGTDGRIKWSKNLSMMASGFITYTGVALGDIDGDNGLEVIVRDGFQKILALDENTGSILWSYPLSSGMVKSPPTLVDVEDEGLLEVLGGNHLGYVPCLESENGQEKWHVNIDPGDIHCNHSVGDIDGDGCFEIVGISCGATAPLVYAIEADCPVSGIEEIEITPTNTYLKVLSLISNKLVNLEYGIEKRSSVRLEVVDITGRTVQVIENSNYKEPGAYKIDWNLSGKPNGIYFLRLETGNHLHIVKKITVIR